MKIGDQKGFTIIELMITVGILAIVMGYAIPSINDFFDKKRVIAAAEAFYSQLAYARAESVARSNEVTVTFSRTSDTSWAFGMVEGSSACTPTETNPATSGACYLYIESGATTGKQAAEDYVLKTISSTDYSGANFISHPYGSNTPANSIIFNPTRGTATGGSDTGIVLRSNSDFEMRVIVSAVGRVKICSPSGSAKIAGYKDC